MSHVEPRRAFTGRATTCRWCGQPLSALARFRGDVCDSMDCRRCAADVVTRVRRAADLEAMRAAAVVAWNAPGLAAAPVLWLVQHADEFAAPHAIDVAEMREYLMALEDADDPLPVAGEADAAAPTTAPVAGHLCALCRGRCCRFGLQGKAFLKPAQLRGWIARHPGTAWVDAVEHYLGFVAPRHLDASCLFHAENGCTLPRERRSQVCNEFACDTLEELRDIAAAAPEAVVLAGIVASHTVSAVAAVSAQGSRLLPDPRAGGRAEPAKTGRAS